MKVLLVSFQNNTDTIGLKYIHSYLCANQVDSHILFMPGFHEDDCYAAERFLAAFKPKVIGISLMSQEYISARTFTAYVKRRFPDMTIVWGGIHASIAPVECLDHADFVFVGESERAFLEFINAISSNRSVRSLPNLAYRSSGENIVNKPRAPVKDLDTFPFPEHLPERSFILHNKDIVRLDTRLFRQHARYSGRYYSLLTTRGCPFACTYCCNSFFSRLYGPGIVRKRSARNIIEELKNAMASYPEILFINIQDDNFFSYDTEWMREYEKLCVRENVAKYFMCRTTPTHVNEEKVAVLKRIGISWIFMGLQSGSERINRGIYNRPVSNRTFLEAARIISRYDIAPFYDVILDNPYETEEDLVETIKVILEIPKPFVLQLFSLCFYQGTGIFERALKENIKFKDPRTKNNAKYAPSLLNRIVRLCPLLPRKFILLLVEHRKARWTNLLVKMVYFPSVLFLEPLVWIKLILISSNRNIFRAGDMIISSFVTGFRMIVFRKG